MDPVEVQMASDKNACIIDLDWPFCYKDGPPLCKAQPSVGKIHFIHPHVSSNYLLGLEDSMHFPLLFCPLFYLHLSN